MSFVPGPIVKADDVRWWPLRLGQTADPPQQRTATAGQALSGQMTSTGGPTQRQARPGLRGTQTGRGAGIQRGHDGEALGKGLPLTSRRVTPEPTHPQQEIDRRRGPRQIGYGSEVTIMDSVSGMDTVGTTRFGSGGRDDKRDAVFFHQQALHQ